jgi:queuine tRNA-ribosyltransferase
LGADIAMNFDECLAFGTEKSEAIKSFERTARWAVRCKQAHTREDQALFGIIQGGFWPKLRRQCARQITEIGFDGYALGGLSVGEGHKKMCEVLDYAVDPMPRNAPRYLMGVGRPLDLVEGVARGIDMFDCVIATRHSRSGMFYTDKGRLRITDKRFRNDMYPPDTSCTCYTCTRFTRAYLHHLFRVGEILAASLTTIHNLTWYASFMARMRVAIENGQFEAFRAWVHDMYPEKTDPPPEERAQGASKRQRR